VTTLRELAEGVTAYLRDHPEHADLEVYPEDDPCTYIGAEPRLMRIPADLADGEVIVL
jgi:hypothetical protein